MRKTLFAGLSILLALILMMALALLVSGCARQEAAPKPLDNVILKLKWLHQSQFAGNYMAAEKGFYADEGLKVDIEPFSFDNPTIPAVAEGKADFGITGGDELMLARAKGMPLKAIAVIYKINPVCAYALKSSGIAKPQDFIGKTVGIERASDGTEINIGILYAAMMSRLGINRSRIKEITIGYDATELLNHTTDVSTGYIINEPNLAIEKGYEVNTILMADYGVNMYADVLFTRDDVIAQKPELVERFLRATLKGWQYAIEHTNETIATVLKYAPDSTYSHEAYMLERSIPLIHTGDSYLGVMDRAQWENVKTILTDQKLLNSPVNIDDVYTNQFVDKIYSNGASALVVSSK